MSTIICKSWEKQVLENTKDIRELQSREEVDVTEINQQLARALKTPISRPNSTELVAVDDTNAQVMIELGDGLAIQNDKLTVTGGGGGASSDILLEVLNEDTDGEIDLTFSWNEGGFISYAENRRTILLSGPTTSGSAYIQFSLENTSSSSITVDYSLYDEKGDEIDAGSIRVPRDTNILSLSEGTKTVYLHIY